MAIIPGANFTIDSTNPISTTDTPINSNSKFGTIKILTTPTKVNATGTDLVGRRNVTIQNNGLNGMYIGNNNLVSKSTGTYLASGSTATFNMDTNIPVEIWAVSIGIPTIVSVLEV